MEKPSLTTSNNQICTVDVLRALTTFLMIFVNDIWSITEIPEWLGHTLAEKDGMDFLNFFQTLN